MLVVAIFALRSPRGPHGAQQAASTSSAASTTAARPSAAPRSTAGRSTPAQASGSATPSGSSAAAGLKAVPLVVLNNTTTPGLASLAAQRFKAGGWTVSGTGNLTNDIASTCAYYEAGNTQAEAAAKALQIQFPTIKRVREKFSGLPAGPVVVVLTPDYSTG